MSKRKILSTVFLGMFFSVATTAVFALEQQVKVQPIVNDSQKPPFIGKVLTDNVNVRAGGDKNFEVLVKLNNGSLIFVAGESFGWYKIVLPKTAYCYVSKDFVEKTASGAIAKVSNLNLRARPDKQSSIIGQISKGDTVTIITETGEGWYQIEPPKNCYGWIYNDLVSYYSSVSDKAEEDTAKKYSLLVNTGSEILEGIIEKIGFTLKKKPGNYKLVKDGKFICYLKSDKYNLKDFTGRPVLLWGEKSTGERDEQVINVVKIQSEG